MPRLRFFRRNLMCRYAAARLGNSFAHPSQQLLYSEGAEHHKDKQDRGDGGGIAHLHTGHAVVLHVGNQGMARIFHAGESRQFHGDRPHRKGAGDLHDRTQHELWLHGRQGDMPQLLPPVGDPIDGPGFVERGIHRLETGDEGQKAYPETQSLIK